MASRSKPLGGDAVAATSDVPAESSMSDGNQNQAPTPHQVKNPGRVASVAGELK